MRQDAQELISPDYYAQKTKSEANKKKIKKKKAFYRTSSWISLAFDSMKDILIRTNDSQNES